MMAFFDRRTLTIEHSAYFSLLTPLFPLLPSKQVFPVHLSTRVLVVRASPFSRNWFESESPSVIGNQTRICLKLLAYFPVMQTLFMEFNKLLVREHSTTLLGFEPEPPSANTHGTSIYPKPLAHFPIIQTLCMEFDQLLIREQAFMTYNIGFESEYLSPRKDRTIFHTQLASYLWIVHAFFV